MVEDNKERSKRINENFESILPRLWDKAMENELKLKSEYLSKLQSKLLEVIRSQIPKDHFDWWFHGKLD